MPNNYIEPPVLAAYACRKSWWVWCDWCAALHCHGEVPGHRAAHCREADSPYRESGYVLKLAGTVSSLTAARPGGAPLHGFLEKNRNLSCQMRSLVLKTWMPESQFNKASWPGQPNRFIAFINENARAELFVEVDVDACTWAVVNTGFSHKELGARRTGRGLHTLAELLFGVPADIATRRIAEIIGAGDPSPLPDIGGANGAA